MQSTAYALLIMLCAQINLTAQQKSKDVIGTYFPESYVQELLEQSNIPEEKWPEIIASMQNKTKEIIEESGIMDLIPNHSPAQMNRKLKRLENGVKKAIEKSDLFSEKELPIIKEKLKNSEKKLNEMFAEKYSKIENSKELQDASTDIKRAEKRIQALIKRVLKEELSAL